MVAAYGTRTHFADINISSPCCFAGFSMLHGYLVSNANKETNKETTQKRGAILQTFTTKSATFSVRGRFRFEF